MTNAKNTSALLCLSDVPTAVLSYGPSLNPKNIKEGDDVYFECHVKSNPQIYSVTWRHNVSKTILIFKNEFCDFSNTANSALEEKNNFPELNKMPRDGKVFEILEWSVGKVR